MLNDFRQAPFNWLTVRKDFESGHLQGGSKTIKKRMSKTIIKKKLQKKITFLQK